MRSLLLVVAVWALLYGAAEILGVMPRIEPPFAADEDEARRTSAAVELPSPAEEALDEPAEEAPPAPALDETDFIGPPQETDERAPDSEPSLARDGEVGFVCAHGTEEPRLHAARLPSGTAAILVDCGTSAELIVPDAAAARGSIAARFTYAGPLMRVEAKDLTSDGRPDLAFAFADRLVLLPTNAFGVWAEPTTLEGLAGTRAPSEDEAARPSASRLALEGGTYVVEPHDEAFRLVLERESGEGTVVRVEQAALIYQADLR
jgi:hypothetical protein